MDTENSTYKKRGGTVDLGRHYENFNAAHLILVLIAKNVENFSLTLNDEDYGDFDDIVLETENEKFAIQLKHVGKSHMVIQQLIGKGGKFRIEKYFESFKLCKKKFKDYKLILYTHLKFQVSDGQLIELEGESFKVKIIKCDPVPILNTNDCGCSYKFEIIAEDSDSSHLERFQEYKTFFEQFFLYSDQANVEQIERMTIKKFHSMFNCNEADSTKYLKFISDWGLRKGNVEKLTKSFVHRIIALCLLSPRMKPITFGTATEKTNDLKKAVSTFNITIFEEKAYENLKDIWGDVKNHIEDSTKVLSSIKNQYHLHVEESADKQDSIALWLMGEVPLIVTESEITFKAIQLCPNEKFFVLGDLSDKDFPNSKIFRNLSDLKSNPEIHSKVLSACKCFLPREQVVDLRFLVERNKEIEKVVTTNDLLNMLTRNYQIDDELVPVSDPYIPRFISKNIVSFAYLENIDKSTFIVMDCKNQIEQVKNKLHNFNLILIDDYLDKTNAEPDFEKFNDFRISHNEETLESISSHNIYVSENECSSENFEEICKRNKDKKKGHHFRMDEEQNLGWIRSSNGVGDLTEYIIKDYLIHEETLHLQTLENNINIVIGEAGMGKSELMRNLKNKSVSKLWTVILYPNEISMLSRKLINEKVDDVTQFITFILDTKYKRYPNFDKQVLKLLMFANEVTYIWDAIDEISVKDLETITNFINRLPKKSTHWITSRHHLKDYIEMKFGVLTMTLATFNEQQQNFYLRNRLESIISEEYIENVIQRLRIRATVTEGDTLLSIPLQIFMLTELFIQDPDKYLEKISNDLFSVIDLYYYIIDEKFNVYYKEKADIRNPNYIHKQILQVHKDTLLKNYERVGFKAARGSQDNDPFIDKIREESDGIGLITNVINNYPQFLHNSYMEYFAATFLSKHYQDKIDITMFDKRNNNIRFFFDLLLAQKSALHIAVLYNNIFLLKNHENKLKDSKDLAGRSLLQLVSSWGQSYPLLNVEMEDGFYIVDTTNDYLVKEESPDHMKILNYLLEKCDVSEANSLDYAEKTNCLFAKTKILKKRNEIFKMTNADHMILYYSAKFGYTEILKLFDELPLMKTKDNCFSLLHIAAIYSQESCLRQLLSCGIYKENINYKDKDGGTALHRACHNGDVDIVESLIEFDADINITTNLGWTSLYITAYKGHYEITQSLVKAGADIHISEEDGWTPFHMACRNGHKAIANFLIKKGAKIDGAAKDGWTSLLLASWHGHYNVVRTLIKWGADINFAKKEGWTALHVACEHGHHEIVQLMIESDANIHAATVNGWTPLHVACANGHEKCARLLISFKADIEAITDNHATPLHIACANRREKVVDFLLKEGAEVNIGACHGWTPLHIACWRCYYEIVDLLLLKYRAKADVVSNDDLTPLHITCGDGHFKTVQLMIYCHAKVNYRANHDGTPLHVACNKGHNQIALLLLENGAETYISDEEDATPLHVACENNHADLVKLLSDYHVDVNISTHVMGRTPLYVASSLGHLETVEQLIKLGARINSAANDGWTPLHVVCSHGHTKTAKVLLKHGANIDICGAKNTTPLHLACESGHREVAELLIKSGCNINPADCLRVTPLFMACNYGYTEVVKLLLEHGADVNIVDVNGCTPIYYAREQRHSEIVTLLTDSGADTNIITTNGKSLPVTTNSARKHLCGSVMCNCQNTCNML